MSLILIVSSNLFDKHKNGKDPPIYTYYFYYIKSKNYCVMLYNMYYIILFYPFAISIYYC